MFDTLHDDDLKVAEAEVPQDVNPKDPHDEILAEYDNWRDWQDYFDNYYESQEYDAELEEYFDYYDLKDGYPPSCDPHEPA